MTAVEKQKVEEILHALEQLQQDATIPRNVKQKLETVAHILQEDEELSLRLNKALNELDDVSDDANIEPYTRTQLWNILSMLESLNA
ncbi:UPF0147 family protein [Candidatus Woesearchaeota archaeon]|nr:UPF0147 family protein [Candidatus Woesearchaeota archaeon]